MTNDICHCCGLFMKGVLIPVDSPFQKHPSCGSFVCHPSQWGLISRASAISVHDQFVSTSGGGLASEWQHAWHAMILNSLWMVSCTGSLRWLSEAKRCSRAALGSSSCWAQHVSHHSIKQAQRRTCRQLSCAQACSLRPATSAKKQTSILSCAA